MSGFQNARLAARPLAGVLVALLCLAPVGSACAGDGGPRLRVDYHPPRLSVDAAGVTLAQVVGEIGAKVGFTVVDNGASSTLLNVSIQNTSMGEVLRQLLRGENHTIVYLTGDAVPDIGTIVLLGEPTLLKASVYPGDRRQAQGHQEGIPGDRQAPSLAVPPAVSPLPVPSPWTPESTPHLSWEGRASADRSADAESPPITVGDIVKAHAMAAVQTGPEAMDGASRAASVPQANLDVVLAETTRRAQQSLAALIDALATATRSMNESLASGRK
jgi:hypothetical protein